MLFVPVCSIVPLFKEIDMRKSAFLSVVLLLLCLSLSSRPTSCVAENGKKAPAPVKYSDIPRKAKLIGPLGTSLCEETVTIRGKWKEGDEPDWNDGCFCFVVTSINGKAIRPSIRIAWERIEPLAARGGFGAVSPTERRWKSMSSNGPFGTRLPKAYDGDEWEMMGWEIGRTTGWPVEILRMYPTSQIPYRGGQIVTTFRFVTARLFGKPHNSSEAHGYWIGHDESDYIADDLEDEDVASPKKDKGEKVDDHAGAGGNAKQRHAAAISLVQAVDLATNELLSRGRKLEDWKMSVVSDSGGNKWLVRFEPNVKLGGPGGAYRAEIDKRSGSMSFRGSD
jgi:hypothetical protein